jgi:hypothetical protein
MDANSISKSHTGIDTREENPLNIKRMILTLAVAIMPLAFGTRTLADNMTISCTPACVSFDGALAVDSSNPVFVVSNVGPTGLSGASPSGIAGLGILLPEPTSLSSWTLTGGAGSIFSGTGVPGYTSGNVFTLFGDTGRTIDFTTFDSLSTLASASLTSYNAFSFDIGAFDTSGTSLGPITNSSFNGASGFPVGTVFFPFLLDENASAGTVVNLGPFVIETAPFVTPEPSSLLLSGMLGLLVFAIKKALA